MREVFNRKTLHLGHFAKSFALRDPPQKIGNSRKIMREKEEVGESKPKHQNRLSNQRYVNIFVIYTVKIFLLLRFRNLSTPSLYYYHKKKIYCYVKKKKKIKEEIKSKLKVSLFEKPIYFNILKLSQQDKIGQFDKLLMFWENNEN